MTDPVPADAVGVVVFSDAYGKHTCARVFIRRGADKEVEIVPVTTGRSFGAASRAAANEMELVCHDIPRRRVVLKVPEASKLAIDR